MIIYIYKLYTYNRTLPPISKILRKHWNILQLDKNLQNLFEEPPVIAYRRCRNLRDLIGGNKLANDKCLKPKAKHTIKKCEPCRIKEGSLCCQQILDTNQFRSHVTGKSYKIYPPGELQKFQHNIPYGLFQMS